MISILWNSWNCKIAYSNKKKKTEQCWLEKEKGAEDGVGEEGRITKGEKTLGGDKYADYCNCSDHEYVHA